MEVALEPLPMTGAVTGIDMGVVSFLTTSEGVHIPNPRHLKASAGKLAAAGGTWLGRSVGRTGVGKPSPGLPPCTGRSPTTPTRPRCGSSKIMT